MMIEPTPVVRFLGKTMMLLGLAATVAVPFYSTSVSLMTTALALSMRLVFLGAAAITLGGVWLQWYAARAMVLRAFPVMLENVVQGTRL